MRLSTGWLSVTSDRFRANEGRIGYVQLKHYTAEYCEWGEGPPLVLLPGLAGGYDLVAPLARRLAKDFRVISFNLRGEDDCFALRRRFGMRDLVGDVAELMDEMYLESPALMGVSFGGVIALEFAARHARRISRLIVQGAGARFERSLLQRVASLVLTRYPLPANNPFLNQFFNLLFGRRQKPGPLFQFVTRQCWRTDQSVMAHRFKMVEQFDVRSRLPRIDIPTLVLACGRDLLVSQDSLDDLCSGLTNHDLVELPDCGHLAFVSQPHLIADIARSHLLSLQAN